MKKHKSRLGLAQPLSPERSEKFAIKLEFNGKVIPEELLEKALLAFGISPLLMRDGDTLDLNYDFNIEYRNVVYKFNLLLELFQYASIVKVDTKELNYGKSLIQELLCKLEQIEKKYQKE